MPQQKTSTQDRIAKAQKEYDDLARQAADSVKADKKAEADIREEMKARLKARGHDRSEIVKRKGAAHRELVEAQQQRVTEIVAAVDRKQMAPEAARAELVTLGHTEASAEIEIARALHLPASNTSPAPASQMPTAPEPPREPVPAAKAVAATPPPKIVDPFSAKVPESREVVYKDPAAKPATK